MMRETMIKYRPGDYASLAGRMFLWTMGLCIVLTTIGFAVNEGLAWRRDAAETGVNLHYVDAAAAMCPAVGAPGLRMIRDGRVTQGEYDAMQALVARAHAADPYEDTCQVPVPDLDYR